MLETLDYTICIGSIPTFLYFKICIGQVIFIPSPKKSTNCLAQSVELSTWHLLPLYARLTFYNSLVLPLFDYIDIAWGDKNNSTLMAHLQLSQNNAARLILDLLKYFSATEAFIYQHLIGNHYNFVVASTTVVLLFLNVSTICQMMILSS